MSLVICSNQEKDGTALRQKNSVYNAWSFRNPLSSTMTIKKNSQVALQSCKVNVDGRVVFSNNSDKFYHYFGDKLNLDGITTPQMDDSTSYPVVTTLTNSNEVGQVVELSVEDLAVRIQEQIRTTSYHPLTKNKFECDVLRNASSLDFLGYKFTFAQNASTPVNSIPPNGNFQEFYSANNPLDSFTFTGGVFQRDVDDDDDLSVGISPNQPMSPFNGSFIVNASGTNANANASGVEWMVGLSRFVQNIDPNGYIVPPYNLWNFDEDLNIREVDSFVDFGLAKNTDGELVLYHNVNASEIEDGNNLVQREVKYWTNASSNFAGSGRTDLNASTEYTDFAFFVSGENVAVRARKDGVDDKGAAVDQWDLVTQYTAGQPADSYFKPINQACWCLHPVLGVGGGNASTQTCTLEVTQFDTPNITGYDPKVLYGGGWYETNELLNTTNLCAELETRAWNDPRTNTRSYVNASTLGIPYSPVMILQPSDIYFRTFGANATTILGFNQSIVDTPISSSGIPIFQSTFAPSLTSSLAMFVRLNNFGQNVTNAFTGNKSKVLAHLPRFDNTNSTGRLYFEPNQLVWLDLDNAGDMQINEFDISFNYINEQYATILQGQSIVCLLFREKGDTMNTQ